MIKKTFRILAPSMVRAGTFFLDRKWGDLLAAFVSLYLPFPKSSMLSLFFVTAFFTFVLVSFEKWMDGSLNFFHFSNVNQSAGDPNEGVSARLNNKSVLF
jgi:hypothetical protein